MLWFIINSFCSFQKHTFHFLSRKITWRWSFPLVSGSEAPLIARKIFIQGLFHQPPWNVNNHCGCREAPPTAKICSCKPYLNLDAGVSAPQTISCYLEYHETEENDCNFLSSQTKRHLLHPSLTTHLDWWENINSGQTESWSLSLSLNLPFTRYLFHQQSDSVENYATTLHMQLPGENELFQFVRKKDIPKCLLETFLSSLR